MLNICQVLDKCTAILSYLISGDTRQGRRKENLYLGGINC